MTHCSATQALQRGGGAAAASRAGLSSTLALEQHMNAYKQVRECDGYDTDTAAAPACARTTAIIT